MLRLLSALKSVIALMSVIALKPMAPILARLGLSRLGFNPMSAILSRFGSSSSSAPMKRRIRAWWNGVEVSDLPPEMQEQPEEGSSDEAPSDHGHGLLSKFRERQAEAWADPRLTVMEGIWGEGMTGPGGRDFVHALIATLGIDKKVGVIEIGTGLGGSTRIIAKETGAWVTGLEPSAALAEAGMELSVQKGLTKTAKIEHCDLSDLALKPESTPLIFSLETFYKAAEKTRMYATLYQTLKTDGQLLFTDLMVPEPNPESEKYQQWAAKEEIAPHPWTIDETRSCLEDHGFKVRLTEDITEAYVRMALDALNEFAGELEPGRIDKPMVAAVLDVVEAWSHRIGLLDAGELAVYRVYARKIAA